MTTNALAAVSTSLEAAAHFLICKINVKLVTLIGLGLTDQAGCVYIDVHI